MGFWRMFKKSIQYYFTDQYKEQPNKYSIAIFTKGLGIENVEMLLKFNRITIQSKLLELEVWEGSQRFQNHHWLRGPTSQ